MTKISIIVPVYNVYDYLERCLNSLVKQTLKDIEIIIVNDGSTDNSEEIINKFQKKYPTKIKSLKKENGGQASARNLGLKEAKGEYIGYVDSDDYIDLSMYEKMYYYAKKKDYDIVMCGMYYSYTDHDDKTLLYNRTKKLTSKDYINSPPSPWNKIYKRELLIKNSFSFPEGIIYEDLAVVPSLGIYTDKIGYLNEALYYYIQREGSTMKLGKYNPKIKNIFPALNNLYSIFEKNNQIDKYYYELEKIYIHHLLYGGGYRFLKHKETKEELKEIADIMKKNFPNWQKNPTMKEFSKKEKIVMILIYYKQISLINFILNLKSKVKKNEKN